VLDTTLPQRVPLVGGEVAQLAGQPLVAALAVGQDPGPAELGETDHHDPAVGLVGAAGDVAAGLQAVDLAGHARRLDALEAGQLADGEVAVPEEAAEHGHGRDAEVVGGVALVGQPAAQPHHGHTQLRRQSGVGARNLLHSGHVVSLTH
jgi:hypothetical protein